MRYPALKFRGQILYSRTSMEVEKAARELLQSLKVKKGVLPGKTAVMQICGNTSLCHAMHIFHSGITSLQFLLEDSTLVKVGVGISSDCAEVLRDYNVSVKSVEDLSYHANQKLGREPKTWGLRSSKDSCLQREILVKLPKLHSFESPTESDLETGKQMFYQKNNLQYAATDAMVSWKLYQVLKSLPDAKDAPLTIQVRKLNQHNYRTTIRT
ncbi:3'-5' exonuclease-like isoform X2 [Populus trichocarpa]|uniref:3'-5' exonuclease-like isoform X2 n=1 Tax=Populus trichocarpa TaxID=3694 RepID=UPI0022799BDE|nr:3'-5' exonuclease-like isoform X2 [Populus trichocarpa]